MGIERIPILGLQRMAEILGLPPLFLRASLKLVFASLMDDVNDWILSFNVGI
jgi:hypothetical protein